MCDHAHCVPGGRCVPDESWCGRRCTGVFQSEQKGVAHRPGRFPLFCAGVDRLPPLRCIRFRFVQRRLYHRYRTVDSALHHRWGGPLPLPRTRLGLCGLLKCVYCDHRPRLV